MPINAVCPQCRNRYQLDASLLGARIRCPSDRCRAVFEVKAEAPAAPAPPPARVRGGSVGEMVPILAAEQATPPAAPPASTPARTADQIGNSVPLLQAEAIDTPASAPSEARSWQDAPPMRRPSAAKSLRGESSPTVRPVPPTPTPTAPPPRVQTPPTATPASAGDWRSGPPQSRADAPARPLPPPPPPPVPTAPPVHVEEVADWRTAPPSTTRGLPEPTVAAVPVELPPGVWQAPPIRTATPPVVNKRKRLWSVVLMAGIVSTVALVIGGVGLGGYFLYLSTEGSQRAQAEKEYADGKYAAAAMRYRKMTKQFDSSPRIEEYRFFAELADMQAHFESVTGMARPDDAMDRATQFLKENEKSGLLKEHQKKFSQALSKLFGSLSGTVKGDETIRDRKVIEKATETLTTARTLLPEFDPEEVQKSEREIAEAGKVIDERMERDRVVKQIEQLTEKPSAVAIRKARELIREQSGREQGFANDGKVAGLLQQLYEGHAKSVKYEASRTDLGPGLAEDVQPGILVETIVDGLPALHRQGDPVTLALARGVLYGLSQPSGRILWAMRVGIDTGTLPVRLPAAEDRPEIVLVQSADTETITAVNVNTGAPLWKYRLSAPSLGRPVIVNRRAYIPTYDGRVHEIELALGQLVGVYNLGQRLTVGGARQEGTSLVFFPADDSCVYVLDVAAQQCVAVLYTEHRSGSLRSEPIIAGPGPRFRDTPLDPAAPHGYLILNQVSGLDTMDLRVFGLPITNPTAAPLTLTPQPRLRGWPWFQPYHDGEKLVMASDAGVVGLFGVRQIKNEDSALFPLLAEEFHLTGPAAGASLLKAGRAQVVQAQEDDFWVLAQGMLQRLQLYIDPVAGRKLAPVWPQARELGSPLHGGQTDASGNTLFLVTQSAQRQACVATAVEAADGKVHWQRQLGVVCQAAPVPLGGDLLVMDQGGSVFGFAASDHPDNEESQWQVGGRLLSGPVEESAALPPVLVASPDGESVYQIAFPGTGTQMLLRRFTPDGEGKATHRNREEKRIDLGMRPAGRPAVGAAGLLLPLEDGTTLRVRLPATADGVNGPDWRAGKSLVDLKAYTVWVDEESFLTTDGGRGISHWGWPKNKPWKPYPGDKSETDPTRVMRARIVAPPLVLPRSGPKINVCVADADGVVTLLEGDLLEEKRRWQTGGKITAGPFLRGAAVGVVVDRKKLVWIDPGKNDVRWEYKAGETIVGEPEVVEGVLVVADQAGRFIGVDVKTGRPRGRGYSIRASVAPAASPLGFGRGRLFVPLTDGTILLLSLRHLGNPLEDVPVVW